MEGSGTESDGFDCNVSMKLSDLTSEWGRFVFLTLTGVVTVFLYFSLVGTLAHLSAMCSAIALFLLLILFLAVSLHVIYAFVSYGEYKRTQEKERRRRLRRREAELDTDSEHEDGDGDDEEGGLKAPLVSHSHSLNGGDDAGEGAGAAGGMGHGDDETSQNKGKKEKELGSRKATATEICIGNVLYYLGRLICTVSTIILWGVAIFILSVRARTFPTMIGPVGFSDFPDSRAANVSRDDEGRGIIHIHADTERGLFYSQGVAHAQSRWWQMEFQRRVGQGNLSAVVGEGGLAIDVEMRMLGVYDAAKTTFQNMPEAGKSVLQAYADGVNAWLREHKQTTLEEEVLGVGDVPEWKPEDSIVWAKLMSLDLSGNMDMEAARLRLRASKLSVERIQQLLPVFQSQKYPIALSPADLVQAGVPMDKDTNASETYGCANPPVAPISPPMPPPGPYPPYYKLHEEPEEEGSASVEPQPRSASKSSFMSSMGLGKMEVEIGGRLWRRNGRRDLSGGWGASNNWVIGGNLTTTGKPVVANDPHLDLTAPSIWILMHLRCNELGPIIPGTDNETVPIDAIGASFPGLPGIVTGRNQHISWGVTNTGADVQDLYIMQERKNPKDKGRMQYMFNGEWTDYVYKKEVIQVKGMADVHIDMRSSVFGRVVSDKFTVMGEDVGGVVDVGKKNTVSLRWVSTDDTIDDTTLMAFYYINKATTYSSFRAALSFYVAPSQNFVFGATNGDFGYQMPGRIPLRTTAHNGGWPVPGNSSTYNWTGFVPFDELPRALNPPEGFVVTANNRITPPGYPHTITVDWDAGSEGYRSWRITDKICNATKGDSKISPHDVRFIQLDSISYLNRDLIAAFSQLDSSKLTSAAKSVQRKFENWDYDTSIGSTVQPLAAAAYVDLLSLAGKETDTTYWHNSEFLLQAFARGKDPACAPKTCPQRFADALDKAASAFPKNVVQHAGLGVQQWGVSMHRAVFKHAILGNSPLACVASRDVAHGGDESTVNVGPFSLGDPDYTQPAGPSYRHIVDLSRPNDNSAFLNPLGQNGNQFSPHYDDLLDDWSEGKYLHMTTHIETATSQLSQYFKVKSHAS